jgi:hypothetical protein
MEAELRRESEKTSLIGFCGEEHTVQKTQTTKSISKRTEK